jgi:hypothetical protein
VNASAVTVSGQSVTITVPDMDPTAGNGDQGILAGGGVEITFTQAAGIQNPNKAKPQASGYTLTVETTGDPGAKISVAYAITSFVSYSPSTGAARDVTVTVTGGGFEKNCTDCKIRFNPNLTAPTAPTTGTEGSGSIDANGVFTGTFIVDASTNKVGWFVWVVDSTGTGKAATTAWVQKAGATPRALTVSPGSKVTVDLVDFTATAALVVWNGTSDATIATNSSVSIGIVGAVSENVTVVPTSGSTATLTPYKFVVPSTMATGTHLVTIRESGAGTKTATFTIDVVSRVLTVVPGTASPGEKITVSGTGFDKTGGTIPANFLTAKAGSGTAFALNTADIIVGTTGAFDFETTVPTIEAFASSTSNDITIKATDNNGVAGSSTSSGFGRTKRTLTVDPTTASPGTAVTVTVTGMTVDNNEAGNTATATFTIASVPALIFPASATFPVDSNGSGTGVVTIPIGTGPATYTFTASDNAGALNADATPLATRTASANVVVPTGAVGVEESESSTGNTVTVFGTAFPPNSVGTALTFGGANAMPFGGFTTGPDGAFSVLVLVPAATNGGSLTPGHPILSVTIGQITGTSTAFAIATPSFTINPAQAAVEDIIEISGTGYSSLVTVDVLTIGNANVLGSPAPRANRNGVVIASVLIPLFNPGTYTVVMSTGANFSATGTFTVVASGSTPASTQATTQEIFADVIDNGDNLVRVWRYDNATQSWSFYDPRPAFELANTLLKTGAGDIVWVNVNTEQIFQGQTLFPGWNLISLS